MNIWQKIIFSCLALIAILLIYQNDRINAEMEVVKEKVANIHKMQIDSSTIYLKIGDIQILIFLRTF